MPEAKQGPRGLEISPQVGRFIEVLDIAQKIEQAQLDVSVKEVEIAKLRLDQADLVSPINGMVTDDGGNRPGLNVSPASNAFLVMDMDSMRLEIEVPVESWGEFGGNGGLTAGNEGGSGLVT
ncbi:MAG: hypothetical protein AAB697_03075 [Patescibacteria group bacterium]